MRCERDVKIVWNEKTVRAGVQDGPKVESSKIVRMDCGPMEAGVWTLRFSSCLHLQAKFRPT
jgi:hypothetical protein